MIYNINNNNLNISISDRGGELLSVKSADGYEYIWQGNARFWSSSAINLFPIAGRLYGGKYTHEGNLYSMDIHGFIKDTLLTAQKNDYGIKFICMSNKHTYNQYPFDFEYNITYSLNLNCVTVKYGVINNGKKPMYFCVGAHPGFNISDLEKNNWYLQFENECNPKKILLNGTFITGEEENFPLMQKRYIMLDNNMHNILPDTVILKDTADSVTLKSDKYAKSVSIHYPQMKYLALWKAKPEAEFLCIEPWSGLPSVYGKTDELKHKKDVITLNANQKYTNIIKMIFD